LKARLIEASGFDAMMEKAFDAELAQMPAETFVDEVLVSGLGVSHVVTGFDFHFGKGRGGTPQMLREAGDRLGFSVDRVGVFCDEGGQAVSSSRIRALLEQGETGEANGLLGYRFCVQAQVTGGEK